MTIRQRSILVAVLLGLTAFPGPGQTQPGDFVLIKGIRQDKGPEAWSGTEVANAVDVLSPRTVPRPTFRWQNGITTQVDTLRAALLPYGYTNLTAVGYSMGGLDAREYVRKYNSDPASPWFNSIITMGTPHQGTPLLRHLTWAGNTLSFWTVAFASMMIPTGLPTGIAVNYPCGDQYHVYVYYRHRWIGYIVSAIVGYIACELEEVRLAPSRTDMTPSSTFLTALNGNPSCDLDINRASITGHEHYPELYRLIASAFRSRSCSGSQNVVDNIYKISNLLYVLSAKNLAMYYFTGNQGYLEASLDYFVRALIIRTAPRAWNENILETSSSDAIVPTSSQAYPTVSDDRFKATVECANHIDYMNMSEVASRVVDFATMFGSATHAPSPPLSLGLATTGCIATSAPLAWDKNCGAQSYDVEVYTNPSLTPPAFWTTQVSGTTASVGGLAPGTTYYWHLRSRNRFGVGGWSSVASFTSERAPVISNLSSDRGSYIYNYETAHITCTALPTTCPITYLWWVTAPPGGNYRSGNQGNVADVENLGVVSPYTLTLHVRLTNQLGSTESSIALTLMPGTRPPTCPYVASWGGESFVVDNNILPLSESPSAGSGLLTDYYKLQVDPVPSEGEYRLQIKEFEHEHSTLDAFRLVAIDHQPNETVAVSETGQLTLLGTTARLTAATRGATSVTADLVGGAPGGLRVEPGDRIDLVFAGPAPDANGSAGVFVRGTTLMKPSPMGSIATGGTDRDAGASFRLRQRLADVFVPLTGLTRTIGIDVRESGTLSSVSRVDRIAPCEGQALKLTGAVHTRFGSVADRLRSRDGITVTLDPDEAIELRFSGTPPPPGTKRSFVLESCGRYTVAEPVISPDASLQPAGGRTRIERLRFLNGRRVAIDFALAESGVTRLTVFDVQGREVAKVLERDLNAGKFAESWDATGTGRGVYFVRLTVGDHGGRELAHDIRKVRIAR